MGASGIQAKASRINLASTVSYRCQFRLSVAYASCPVSGTQVDRSPIAVFHALRSGDSSTVA